MGTPAPYDDDNTLFWTPGLVSFGDIRTAFPQTETGYGGVAIPHLGEIEIQLADSSFRYLAEQSWDSRTITVRAGLTTDPIPLYNVIFRGSSSRAEATLNTLRITLRDPSLLFNRTLQQNTYAGTGGYEGGALVKGKVKPLTYGRVDFAPPILVDESINLYQLHDGVCWGYHSVFTGAVSLTYLGDLPAGATDLTQWSPTQAEVNAGGWRSHNAAGMMRLAAPPTAPITVNFSGTVDIPNGTHSIGNIVDVILRDHASDLTVDMNSMSRFITRWGNSGGGISFTESTTVMQALDDIARPMGVGVALSRLGEITITTFERGAVIASIQSNDIVDARSTPVRRSPPVGALTYRVASRRHILLRDSDLLANATGQARETALTTESFSTYTLDAGAKVYDSSRNVEFLTRFSPYVDTQNEKLMRQLAHRDHIFSQVYDLVVMGFLYQFGLGDTIIFEIPEMGFLQTRTGIIIGITERSPTTGNEDQTELTILTHS